MGIEIKVDDLKFEINLVLALEEFSRGKAGEPDYLPSQLEEDAVHHFLKDGQRSYKITGPIPLVTKKDHEAPLAEVTIIEPTHSIDEKGLHTRGRYKINRLLPAGEEYNAKHEPK